MVDEGQRLQDGWHHRLQGFGMRHERRPAERLEPSTHRTERGGIFYVHVRLIDSLDATDGGNEGRAHGHASTDGVHHVLRAPDVESMRGLALIARNIHGAPLDLMPDLRDVRRAVRSIDFDPSRLA